MKKNMTIIATLDVNRRTRATMSNLYSLHRNIQRNRILLSAGALINSALLGGCLMTNTAHAKTISPTTATYTFSFKDKVSGKGKATRILSKSGDAWTYQVNASALMGTATAKQYSRFKIVDKAVKPTSASTSYKLLKVGNTHEVAFAGKTATSTYKGKNYILSMPHQAFDGLSLEVQIRQDLLNGQFDGNYYLVKKDKIEEIKFKKSGSTKITVPAGIFDTLRIEKVHDDKGRQTTFWLAPSLDYLPVKVVQNDDTTRIQMELSTIK